MLIPTLLKERNDNDHNSNHIKLLKKLDRGCNVFSNCHSSLQRGAHFYSDLTIYLDKFTQIVNDFVNSRRIAKKKLLSKIAFNKEYKNTSPKNSIIIRVIPSIESKVNA